MQKLKGESGEMGWADNTGLDDKCRVFTKNGKSVDCPCRCVPFGRGLAFEYVPECKVHGLDDDKEYFTPSATGITTPRMIPRPQWTKEPPTVPGWYWCRTTLEDGTNDADKGALVEVMQWDGKILYRHASMIHFIIPHDDLRWNGPILPPE